MFLLAFDFQSDARIVPPVLNVNDNTKQLLQNFVELQFTLQVHVT